MADAERDRVMFLRGVLAAFASSGQVVHYDEVRRLVRASREMMGDLLGQARSELTKDEPDLCAVVVNNNGTPGAGWGDAETWAKELRAAHQYWSDRRQLDNEAFEKEWGDLPSMPQKAGSS